MLCALSHHSGSSCGRSHTFVTVVGSASEKQCFYLCPVCEDTCVAMSNVMMDPKSNGNNLGSEGSEHSAIQNSLKR